MATDCAAMVEVQKTAAGGHGIKLQWDRRALDHRQADALLGLFDRVLDGLGWERVLDRVVEAGDRKGNGNGEGNGKTGAYMRGLWKKE